MALRDQPYIPLYVKDILTDEKLALCTAESMGVYIFILCILHKQEKYGCLLLRPKFNSGNKIDSFASLLAKQMPYEFHTVKKSLVELIDERVLSVEGDMLIQKRMIKDNEISEKRAASGKIGGKISVNKIFAQANAVAKNKANPVYENEAEIETEIGNLKSFGKSENLFFKIEDCLEIALKDDRWIRSNKTSRQELEKFNQQLEGCGEYEKNPLDYKTHFYHLKRKRPDAIKPEAKQLTMDEWRSLAREQDKNKTA